MSITTCCDNATEMLLTLGQCRKHVNICRLSPDLLDKQWLQQHEARLVQQLQRDGWTGRSSNGSSSRAAPGTERQSAVKTDKQLQASVRSAAAAGLSPRGVRVLLAVHEECRYVMRNAALQQVCLQMAASVQG
jgi:hypothetical protein